MVWILIIMLHSVGIDLGSPSNAIDHVAFQSQEACEAAAKTIKEQIVDTRTFCFYAVQR